MQFPRIAVILASLLASSAFAAAPAPSDTGGLLLSGFEDPIKNEWKHQTRADLVPFKAETSPDKVKEGAQSGKWTDLARYKWIELIATPSDWSAWEALSLWIYAETANGQKINLVVGAPKEGAQEGYYLHQLTIDWTGWRQIVVPFKTFKPNRAPAPWSAVKVLRFTAGGWGAEPLLDTVLYLDDLRLIRR
ncbi:Carbohydrate binding domain (family 11) [Opitutaceae bacterium TAV1]|nr:Carbohydrate binding domain (family 11) [Opitutaceae bacterium TAV1]